MLSGIRIIDFSQYLPGPYATMRLAEMGAEVIVVEPLVGEPSRQLSKGYLHLANNRNKKSISINLKEEAGQEVALDLIDKADVVIESFRPGVMKRLGLDYETVKKRKETIIYCSLSGYGQSGKISTFGGHDLNYLAVTGVLSQLADVDGKPIVPTIQFADYIGAFSCTEAILAALIQRFQSRKGSYIDLALIDPLVSILGTNFLYYCEERVSSGVPELTGEAHYYSIYQTKDARYVVLAALEQKFWINFCKALSKDEWIPMHPQTSLRFKEEISHIFLKKTWQEWLELSLEVDCCLTPIRTIDEVVNATAILDRGLVNGHFALSRYSPNKQALWPSPKLGEHTEIILKTVTNYDADQIERLQKNKIVRSD